MVLINGNFRNLQLFSGATNRNTSTAKATLQANTVDAKFRPSGKTATFKITDLNHKPEQYKTNYDSKNVDTKNLKPGDTITYENKDGSKDVFVVTSVNKNVVDGKEPGSAYNSVHMGHIDPNGALK